jgi:hypothetical protein
MSGLLREAPFNLVPQLAIDDGLVLSGMSVFAVSDLAYINWVGQKFVECTA